MFDFKTYNTEILRFLYTVTIKYDPWVEFYNRKYPSIVVDNDPYTYPYYKNVQGLYHELDTKVITNNGIEISRTSLDANPLLRISFKNDFARIYKLFNDYPNQLDIIRTSIWPVNKSYQEIIDANNLTLIGYDAGYLDSNEREDIVAYVQKLLLILRERWFNPYFFGEEQFHPVWWSIMWSILHFGIHTRRIENINNESVHNMHIRETLLSNGFPECKLMLNRSITKFIYKNLYYLDKKKGRNEILDIVNDHLLKKVGYTLNKYKIIKRSDPDIKKLIPDVVLSSMDDTIDKNESMEQETFRIMLANQNLVDPTMSEIEKQNRLNKITYNKSNEVDTKYLLLNKASESSIYQEIFYSMIFDLLISTWAAGDCNISYNFETEIMNTDFDVNVSPVGVLDLIYLFNYAVNIACKNIPTELPTSLDTCFTVKPLDEITLPNYIIFAEKVYNIYSYLDVDQLYSMMFGDINIRPIRSRNQMYQFARGIFGTLIACIQNARGTNNVFRTKSYEAFYKATFTKDPVSFVDPNGFTTYEEYFESRTDLKSIITMYPSEDDMVNMANNIINNIINVDDNFHPFIKKRTSSSSNACLINMLKRFTSYNVNFITNTIVDKQYGFAPKFDIGETDVFAQFFDGSVNVGILEMIESSVTYTAEEKLNIHIDIEETETTITGKSTIYMGGISMEEVGVTYKTYDHVTIPLSIEEKEI